MSNVLEGSAVQQFEVAQGFIERCQARNSVQALTQSFQQAKEALGFRHFACCSHVDPLRPPRRVVMLHTYRPQVAREFSKPIRDLLGYRIHRPNLGGNEGQDPAVLFETRSHTLAAVDAIPPAVALELQAHYQNRAAGSQG